MKRHITKLLISSTLLLASNTHNVLAKSNDYDSNYYKEEGIALFKFYGSGIFTKSKFSDIPNPTQETPTKDLGTLISKGYGLGASATIFWHKNIAAAFSTGANLYKISNEVMQKTLANYVTESKINDLKLKKNILAVPLSFTLQYHIAPYGAIRPYIGTGYHYTWMLASNSVYQLDSIKGVVLQAGVDFILTDDTVISLDIKRYSANSKLKLKAKTLDLNQDIAIKTKLNPVVVSLGIGWRF